jgi:hypothetical protein
MYCVSRICVSRHFNADCFSRNIMYHHPPLQYCFLGAQRKLFSYIAVIMHFKFSFNIYIWRSRSRFPMSLLDFWIYVILPATLWPWGRLSVWQKCLPGIFLGVKGSWRVELTASPPSVSRLSRKCRCLDVSQSYGLPRSVTGIVLLYIPTRYSRRKGQYSGRS